MSIKFFRIKEGFLKKGLNEGINVLFFKEV